MSDEDAGVSGASPPPLPEITQSAAEESHRPYRALVSNNAGATVPTTAEPQASYRHVFTWLFLIGSVVFVTIVGFVMIGFRKEVAAFASEHVVHEHFAAVIGLPLAAIASLWIVLLCDIGKREKMKFKALGFEFEGAASQVVLWIVTFLAMAFAVKALW